jgi:hypothetical protein
VPKRRTSPPTTPLGAWLERWLLEHPEWTHQRLADEVDVSKGVVSQWISGEVRTLKQPSLVGLARATGEPLANLEELNYGKAAPERPGEGRGRYLTAEELESLMERAAKRAVREVLAELGRDGAA